MAPRGQLAHIYLDQPERAHVTLDGVLAVEKTPFLRTKALYVKGATYYESNDSTSAIEALHSALAQNARPRDEAQVHALLAQIYLESGDEVRAKFHLNMLGESSEQPIGHN